MSIKIVWKVALTAVFTGTTMLITLSIVDPEALGIYSDVFLYVKTYKISNSITQPQDQVKFKCQFKPNVNEAVQSSFDCEIFKLKNNIMKKHIVSELAEKENLDKLTNNSELFEHDKVFQIKFSSKYWKKGKNIGNAIEIVEPKLNENVKYANLQKLFAIYNNKKIVRENYFIVQAPNNTSDVIDLVGNGKCLWGTKNIERDCEIYDFSLDTDKTYDELTFSAPKKQSTKIIPNKYYLIKFVKAYNKSTIDISYIKNKKITYENGNNKKMVFEKITAAFYDSNYDHIFIL